MIGNEVVSHRPASNEMPCVHAGSENPNQCYFSRIASYRMGKEHLQSLWPTKIDKALGCFLHSRESEGDQREGHPEKGGA